MRDDRMAVLGGVPLPLTRYSAKGIEIKRETPIRCLGKRRPEMIVAQ